MKKSLLALAAMGAFAGAAHAQSSVTVYGKLDSGFSNRVVEGTSVTSTGSSMVFNAHETSRFGLRGTEDLGGGLKANFMIETQIGDDNSNSSPTLQGTTAVGGSDSEALGGRAMWAGISGNFGEVRVGNQNAFSKDYVAAFSSSGGSNVVGDPTMAAGRAIEKTSKSGLLDSRYVGVSYATPTISGFTAKVMIVSDKQDNATANTLSAGEKNSSGQEFAIQFAQGPIAAAVSYGQYEANGTTIATNLAVTSAETATLQKHTLLSVNASYDFGVAKLFAKYGSVVQTQVDGSPTTDGKSQTTVIGVRAPVGNTALFANYAAGTYESVTGTTSFNDSGYQLGIEHSFSKRTKIYGIYGATDTDISATTKERDRQYAIGLVHNF